MAYLQSKSKSVTSPDTSGIHNPRLTHANKPNKANPLLPLPSPPKHLFVPQLLINLTTSPIPPPLPLFPPQAHRLSIKMASPPPSPLTTNSAASAPPDTSNKPAAPPVNILPTQLATTYSYIHPAALLSAFAARFPALVNDPVSEMAQQLPFLALAHVAYVMICLPAAGTDSATTTAAATPTSPSTPTAAATSSASSATTTTTGSTTNGNVILRPGRVGRRRTKDSSSSSSSTASAIRGRVVVRPPPTSSN